MGAKGKPEVVGEYIPPEAPRQYRANRICRVCGAKLSRYNPMSQCMHHDDPRDDRILTRHSTRR